MTVKITNYSAIITNILVPDRLHRPTDVVLGYDTWPLYRKDKNFFGAIVGRYANRIANAQFKLNGTTYHLVKNNGNNSLHSGPDGFNLALWAPRIVQHKNTVSLVLTYNSPNGEQGFPGNLKTTITYTLYKNQNKLITDYQANTDQDTFINLTNHTYFNLSGEGNGKITDEKIKLYAHHYTPTDEHQIPTGAIQNVKNTPFDLTHFTAIKKYINSSNQQMRFGHGYDHNFVLDQPTLAIAAKVYSPRSAIQLSLYTSQPGVQFYSGNSLNPTVIGKHHHIYDKRTGFALETQHYPDSPHHPNFPSTQLKPHEHFHAQTIYLFGIRHT